MVLSDQGSHSTSSIRPSGELNSRNNSSFASCDMVIFPVNLYLALSFSCSILYWSFMNSLLILIFVQNACLWSVVSCLANQKPVSSVCP